MEIADLETENVSRAVAGAVGLATMNQSQENGGGCTSYSADGEGAGEGKEKEQVDDAPLDVQPLRVVEEDNAMVQVDVLEAGNEVVDEEELVVDDIPYTTPDGKSHTMSTVSGKVTPPTEGMVFESWEMIETYLKKYGKQEGFGIVRAASANRYRDGKRTSERRSVRWECEYFGKQDKRVRVNRKKVNPSNMHSVSKTGVKLGVRKSKKCNCPVHFCASAERDGLAWAIRKAVINHEGHRPTPSKSRHVPSYRQEAITDGVRKRLFNELEVGVKLPLIHRSMALERNGLENMPFTQRDLRNVAAKYKRMKMEMEGGDANAMVNYLRKMTADNEKFFHAERVDAHDRLKDVMWVDARNRAAYEDFGDVVCFDTTYITNKFHLPFANFVGVNHHGQTILFGCALIRHETTETFEWLFSKWLSCMGGKAPAGFLTDQCAAMRKALANVMPQSRHRWCLWHILQKFYTKLGSYKDYDKMKEELHNVIYDSITVEEFNRNWAYVIQKYNLQHDEWLQGLCMEQEMWVPAHMRSIFWAGMKTTQRSESINSFFDGYVKRHTMLFEFISQYFAAVEARAYAEGNADADCVRNLQNTATNYDIEAEFQKLYTTSKFIEFQVECLKLLYVNMMEKRNVSEFLVEHRIEDPYWYRCQNTRKDYPTTRYRDFFVVMDMRNNNAWCNCKHFETHGIMCRHLIRVFACNRISKLPDMFVLDRWRKDIERKHTKVKVRHHDLSKTEEVSRYDDIMIEVEPLCLLGAKNEEIKDSVIQAVRSTIEKLQQSLGPVARSKEGDNIEVSPSSVNNKRAAGEKNPGTDSTTPPSLDKNCSATAPAATYTAGRHPSGPSTEPVSGERTDSVACGGEQAGNVGEPQLPLIIKDPPLPKQPRHRTTDSRYKSAAERNRGKKGKGASKGKGSEEVSESQGSTGIGCSVSLGMLPQAPFAQAPVRQISHPGAAHLHLPQQPSIVNPILTLPPAQPRQPSNPLLTLPADQPRQLSTGEWPSYQSPRMAVGLPIQVPNVNPNPHITNGVVPFAPVAASPARPCRPLVPMYVNSITEAPHGMQLNGTLQHLAVPSVPRSIGAIGICQPHGPSHNEGHIGYLTRNVDQPGVPHWMRGDISCDPTMPM